MASVGVSSFTDKSQHLPLKDVNKIGGTGTETDVNKPGIAIVYAPVNLTTDCKSVEMYQKALPEAVPGDNVKNLSVKELRRGYVVDDLKKIATQRDPKEDLSSFRQVEMSCGPNRSIDLGTA
ncbi:hypothetical protein pipiens_004291 [Culex pipiens pipiens]|uniref:Uncharacterized protein n=1 Tax=Culex pipiens pipiens TaxID=38569 RepID=A0ABD1CK87_CULPP